MKKSVASLLVMMLAAVVFAACNPFASQQATSESTDAMMEKEGDAMMEDDAMMEHDGMEKMEKDGEAMMKSDEEADFTLSATNFSYAPNTITAKAGETITVKLEIEDGFHDFVIDELDVATSQISTGESEMVEITIPEDASGESYEFYCSVGNHRAQGMVGTLVIE